MAAKPGLTPYFNPMAQELQGSGRGGDTMLVHMHPDEVKGLQQLAMAHGGSLTINPHTGLPEAGFLKKLLPTILGVALNFIPGVGPLMSAALVGAGYTAATGSLKKGLMAGLQAYGGAGIGAGLSKLGTAALAGKAAQGLGYQVMGEVAKTASVHGAPGVLAQAAPVANMIGGEIAKEGVSQAAQAVAGEGVKQAATEVGKQTLGQAFKSNAINAGSGLKALAESAMSNPIQAVKDFGGAFSGGVKADPWLAKTPFLQKVAPFVAGQGAFSGVTSAMQPDMPTYSAPEETKCTYDGPYTMPFQQVSYPGADDESSAEHAYFTQSNPVPGYRPAKAMNLADGGLAALPASDKFKELVAFYNAKRPGPITASIKPTKPERKQLTSSDVKTTSTTSTVPPTVTVSPEVLDPSRGRYGAYTPGGGWWGGASDFSNLRTMAAGGPVNMDDGSFVVDARTVSELGNGSSNAGIEHLQKIGGRPIQGPGDGVSDSIPASIGGRQPARVARDEVVFPPQAVQRIGGGSERRGTQKLYAMMDKAHAARKRAGRGTDTKLRRGLA